VVELEQAAKTLAALDRPRAHANLTVDQLVADALVIPLVVEVEQVSGTDEHKNASPQWTWLGDGRFEVPLPLRAR
jgi:hypothetical protein